MTHNSTTTESRTDRQQLRASRAYFHAIVTRSADGVLVIDEAGIIRYANPAAQTILGRSLEALLGSVFGVPCVPGEPIEIDVVRDDGATRVAEMRVSATNWEHKSAFLAMIRDVTERREAELKAVEDVRRRDEFLAMLSHELRNPVATISNAARVAIRSIDANPAGVAPALKVIDRQCGHVRRLLDDLLDVSRFTCGKIDLRRERTVLQRVVADAVETSAQPADGCRQEVHVRMPPEPLFVDGDPARLVQVVVNLLGNAFKFTPDGGSVEVLVTEGADGTASINVRDDGCGLPADRLDSIFEPFVQLDSAIDHGQPGLGMGLALVKMIVDRHEGTVSVTSDGPGFGSTFTVTLPLVETGCENEVPETVTGRPARILLAEDNGDLRDMMRSLLELDGHEVTAVESGLKAVEAAKEGFYDIAFVDIGMPGIDGYGVAQQLRRCPELDALRLVALTGYGLPEDVQRALEAGFDHHLVKPVELDAINEIIELGSRAAC